MKFSHSKISQIFVVVFTTAFQWPLIWARWIEATYRILHEFWQPRFQYLSCLNVTIFRFTVTYTAMK